MGKSEHSQNFTKIDLKKKTPTQLRRERKKRQKERERRQKELERRTHEEGGGEKRGRGSLLEKTSANPSTSTSRTASPLSSIDNNTSDTPLESVSLSPSQSPLPPADEDAGEPGNKSRGGEGGGEEERNVQSGKKDLPPTCASVNTGSPMENTTQSKTTTRENQQLEIRTVKSPVHEPVPPVTKTEECHGIPKTPSDRGSIEWDVSQMRQERVEVASSSPHSRQVPEPQGKESSLQSRDGCGETPSVVNGEVLSSCHGTPLENNFSTDVKHSWKSSSSSPSSSSLLTLVRNGVLPHRTANSLSSTTSQHLCNGPSSALPGIVSSLPSTVLPSSTHSNERIKPAIQKSPSTSDAHVLEPKLTGKSRLKENMDSDQSIVLDGHEE